MPKKTKYTQGKYRPKNPQKYIGDPTEIYYRSGWELRMMKFFDFRSDIIRWGSEEIIVPYISPVDGKWHRYFPDFKVQFRNKYNETETWIVEVKPKKETIKPVRGKKKEATFINECLTYSVNEAKWLAAKKWCDDRKYKFEIVTEEHIFGKN